MSKEYIVLSEPKFERQMIMMTVDRRNSFHKFLGTNEHLVTEEESGYPGPVLQKRPLVLSKESTGRIWSDMAEEFFKVDFESQGKRFIGVWSFGKNENGDLLCNVDMFVDS